LASSSEERGWTSESFWAKTYQVRQLVKLIERYDLKLED
jgi:hypothetical protein